MNTIKTYIIKGMVCDRCVTTLKSELEQNNVSVYDVTLGTVNIIAQAEKFDECRFINILMSLGFSLGANKNTRVVDQVKLIVRNYFDELDPLETKIRFSDLMSDKLNMTYDNISSIFSAHEKITIENYIILYRINIVKYFLENTPLTLTEIAYKTGFSSIHHLSKQFKDVTGTSPSDHRTVISPTQNHVSNQGKNIIFMQG